MRYITAHPDRISFPDAGTIRSFITLRDPSVWDERVTELLAVGMKLKDIYPLIEREARAELNADQGIETVASIPIPDSFRGAHLIIEQQNDDYMLAWHDESEQRLATVVVPGSILTNVLRVLAKGYEGVDGLL